MENKETGGQVEDNNFSCMQLRQLNNPIRQCQHCYCGRAILNSKEHLVCCMCAHRILSNPISLSNPIGY